METGSGQPTFDAKALLERLGADQRLVRILIDAFLEESPNMLARMRRAVEAGDAAAVQSSAHAARGALLNVSAELAASLAEQLETRSKDGDLDSSTDLLRALEVELVRVEREMRSFRVRA